MNLSDRLRVIRNIQLRRTAPRQVKIAERITRRFRNGGGFMVRAKGRNNAVFVTIDGRYSAEQTRHIVVTPFGDINQSLASTPDPQWRAAYERWHADSLTAAAIYRQHKMYAAARREVEHARRARLGDAYTPVKFLEAAE